MGSVASRDGGTPPKAWGAGSTTALPPMTFGIAAGLFAASGLVGFLATRMSQMLRRGGTSRAVKFEYGPVDITLMTAAEAKKLRTQRRSLIPDALADLEESGGNLASDAVSAEQELDQRAKALAKVGAPPFKKFLKEQGAADLVRKPCKVLQLNIGLYCNQACTHCHVESSPLRKEQMSMETVERCLQLLRASPGVEVLDITGGAPELNQGFRRLVEGAAELRDSGARPNLRIIDRCNLTVLLEPGQEDLAAFLVRHRVDIVASLPSYDAAQTNRQRGRRVFEHSIEALRMLNELGYGTAGPANCTSKCNGKDPLRLDLVFNPSGPFLPPEQHLLDAKFRDELGTQHSVSFDNLITITNMPIKRFFDFLRKKGTLEGYMDLLVRNFNPQTVPSVMCVDYVSVGWDGRLFDCDFNQQLDLTLGSPTLTVFSIDSLHDRRLLESPIRTAAHCFGCTAAQGSS